jgi:3-hydroxybutyryl-CoA dehydrogenase
MGATITACLLAAGHRVGALSLEEAERQSAKGRVLAHLEMMESANALSESPTEIIERLRVSSEDGVLCGSEIVIEAIIEDLAAKHQIFARVEKVVGASTLIASNTSALSITALQSGAEHPERILGFHWLSSSPLAPPVEIMGGAQTDPAALERAAAFARLWKKEPVVMKGEARGFIANRIYYAMLREAFALVAAGHATPAEVDASLQGSLGIWLPFAGPFRYLDLSGLAAYPQVFKEVLPELSSDITVPAFIEEYVASGERFYEYSAAEADGWQREFQEFRREVLELARRHIAQAAAEV